MSTDEPTRDEIDDFIRSNDVDDRAANDLRDCPADIQRKVLARGELSTARNPSAALLARIRDARNSGTAGGYRDSGGSGRNGVEIEDFIKGNDVDESAADSLRSSSPTIQRAVLARGDLKSARNPSSALLARIRDAKSGIGVGMPQNGGGGNYGNYGACGGGGYGMGGGYGAYGAPPGPGPGGYPGYGAGAYGAYGAYGYPGYPPPGYGGYPPTGAYGGYGQAYGGSQGYGSTPGQGYGGQQPALTQGYGYGMSQGDRSRSRGRSSSNSSRSSSSSYSRSRSRSRSRAKPPPKRAKRGKEDAKGRRRR